ncbi:hypothetical protein ACFV2D_02185 [Streptomyces capillispiralis]|uniref:hypothetical protein n=1 Tax=Streptomyces capillispiralis TaxID=68182 RepID=UPI0036983CA7
MSLTQQYVLDTHRARQHGEPPPPAPGLNDWQVVRELRDLRRSRAVPDHRPAPGRLRAVTGGRPARGRLRRALGRLLHGRSRAAR